MARTTSRWRKPGSAPALLGSCLLALCVSTGLPSLARAAEEVWTEDEEPEPSAEFVAFHPGSFTAQLHVGPTITLAQSEPGATAERIDGSTRVGVEMGTLLWADLDREWQNSLGVSAYWDGAGRAGTSGGGSVEHEFLFVMVYLRGGPAVSRSRLYSGDFSHYETAAGGNLGLGLALWRLRAGLAYEGRATFGPDPLVRNTLMFTVGVSTQPSFQDLGIGGGGGFDVGCLFLMCNDHY